MKKFFSLLSFMVIMFVSATVANADPVIRLEITGVDFNPPNGTLTLYTTLTNVGDKDAEVHTLNVDKLTISAGDGSNQVLFSAENFTLKIPPCYLKAGGQSVNVEWVMQAQLPEYSGEVHSDMNGEVVFNIIN